VRVFDERIRRVTRIAARILLADVCDRRFGLFILDLKSGDERTFGVPGNVVRLLLQFYPDGELNCTSAPPLRKCGPTGVDVQITFISVFPLFSWARPQPPGN
jgi:hypothetical protein